MKKILAALLLATLSTHLIVCSEVDDNQSIVMWENCKKIIRDNPDKVLVGMISAIGGLIMARHFYFQNRILQEIVDLRRENKILGEVIGLHGIVQEVDELYEIIKQDNINDVVKSIEKFLGDNEKITVDLIAGKVHICWHNPQDYGKPALYKLEQLLSLCKDQYQYPTEIETHDINRKLECILVSLKVNKTK